MLFRSTSEFLWQEGHTAHATVKSPKNIDGETLKERADLNGLLAHDSIPRILQPHDIKEGESIRPSIMKGHMAASTHRERNIVEDSATMIRNLMVAKPVPRSEFIHNPKAMDAYWKEWSNLESKRVWKWEIQEH